MEKSALDPVSLELKAFGTKSSDH